MIRKRKPGKTYIKEFKLDAFGRMKESDRPASEIALKLDSCPGRQLGI